MDGPVISKLVLPNSVKIIEDEAFSGMDVPEGVTIDIGSGIQKIGQSAFDCAVKSLTIHRKKDAIPDGSYGWTDAFDEWHNPAWYGGRTENPQAIWDGVA